MTPFKLQKRGFCNLPSVSCIAIGPPVKDDENTGGPKESDPGVCTLPIILRGSPPHAWGQSLGGVHLPHYTTAGVGIITEGKRASRMNRGYLHWRYTVT